MKKIENIQILCFFNNDLAIGLSGVRENMGHDDSLPYQAEVFIYDRENNPDGSMAFQKLGEIWNDGWGGESNFTLTDTRNRFKDYLKKVTELCELHYMYWKGSIIGSYKLTDLCDIMAECYLGVDEKTRKNTLLYRFDDDPVVIANKGHNLFKF